MTPSKTDLVKLYDIHEHFGIGCFLDNPNLDKLLTGEGAKVAKENYKDYIEIDAQFDKEDKYKIWQIASKINDNPDVSFFTCVADRTLQNLHIEFWGTDELLAAARLVGENGDMLLGFLTNERK